MPDSEVYDALDEISGDAEAVFRIVDSLICEDADDRLNLSDAAMEAAWEAGQERLVIAVQDVFCTGYDEDIYFHILRALEQCLGKGHTVMFWLPSSCDAFPANEDCVKKVARLLKRSGFTFYQCQRENQVWNILFREDMHVKDALKIWKNRK